MPHDAARVIAKPKRRRTFTVVVDFDGGTYISQFRVVSPKRAATMWVRRFDFSILGRVSAAAISSLRMDLADDDPTPIDGVKNVWCTTGRLKGKLVLLNIVATRRS